MRSEGFLPLGVKRIEMSMKRRMRQRTGRMRERMARRMRNQKTLVIFWEVV